MKVTPHPARASPTPLLTSRDAAPLRRAFTIRTGSRRTIRHVFVAGPGAAPVGSDASDISANPLSRKHGSLVRRHHGEVCPLSRGVMSPLGSTPIRPATGRRWLAPRSSTRRPMGSPHGSLSPREGDGFTTFRVCHLLIRAGPLRRWLLRLRQVKTEHLHRATYHFGPSLSAPLACSISRRLRSFTCVDPSSNS